MSGTDAAGGDSTGPTGSIRSMIRQLFEPVEPVLEWVLWVIFGSAFRFLILLGITFIAIAIVRGEGAIAGHLGLYGATAIAIGIAGWVISKWKVKQG